MAVSLRNQRREVQIQGKVRGSPSEHVDEKKVFFVWRPWNSCAWCRQARRKSKTLCFYLKKISQMITHVCVMQLRTFCASDATLPTSELWKLKHDTSLWWRKCSALRLTLVPATCYTHAVNPFLCLLLHICFRCNESSLLTSPVDHYWTPVFQSLHVFEYRVSQNRVPSSW